MKSRHWPVVAIQSTLDLADFWTDQFNPSLFADYTVQDFTKPTLFSIDGGDFYIQFSIKNYHFLGELTGSNDLMVILKRFLRAFKWYKNH